MKTTDRRSRFRHLWAVGRVSLVLVLLCALCIPSGCGPDDRDEISAPSTTPQPESNAAQKDRQPVVPISSHPIDQTKEGAIYRRAVAALDEGDVEGAMAARQQLQGHPQFGVLAEAVDAFALVKQGKYDEAMRAAERLSKIPVMQAETYLIAGEVFHAQGNWTQAIGAFRSALELHPELTRAHRWLGAIHHDTGAMQLATDHLRKAAELDPNDYRSLRLCGLIQYEYQKYNQAVDDYRRALQRTPPEKMATEIRLELADSLRELRQVDDALATLAVCAESTEVAVTRATCYETGGKLDEALSEALKAVELTPKHAQGNLVLGKLYLALRRAEDAIVPLQVAVQADPTNHEPRFLLGRALLQTGRTEEGKAQLERSTELKETFLQLADLHIQAIGKPYDVEVRLQLGELAEKLGRSPVALSWYRAALGLDPGNQQAATAITRLNPATKQESGTIGNPKTGGIEKIFK